MTKQMILVAALMTALGSNAWAQGARGAKPPEKPAPAGRAAATDKNAGHEAPKSQPTTAPNPNIPSGEMVLGTVTLRKAVKADGKTLPPGTYQVRLTAQTATPVAPGETPSAERWVEFLRGGKVVGREVVTIVPQGDVALVQKDAPPPRNGVKVDTLKGGDYVRVWFNKGNHYLIHLPVNA